jgi:Tfp pilus tip-associated adhesin PilY1
LLFTTFAPDTGEIDDCSAGLGSGRIFGIDFITGLAALSRVPGAQAVIGSDTSFREAA